MDLFKVLQALYVPKTNGVFSPHSIRSCLELLRQGVTEGSPLAAQLKGLRLNPPIKLEDAVSVNAVWSSKDVLPEYIDRVRGMAEIHSPVGTAREINEWVTKATKGSIDSVVSEETVRAASCVLVNALLYRRLWQTTFPWVGDEPFYCDDGEEVAVETMLGIIDEVVLDTFHVNTWRCRAAQLSYQGKDACMIVVVPPAETIDKMVTEHAKELLQAVAGMTGESVSVEVHLPCFEAQGEFDLIPALKACGLKDLDTVHQLERMMPGGQVSAACHVAKIEVTAEGTQVAAASCVVVAKCAQQPKRPRVEKFYANTPFIYVITEGAIPVAVGWWQGPTTT